MSVRSETRTISGIEITVTQLPARRAFRLMTKLARAIVPILEKGINGSDDLLLAMPIIISQLSPDEADALSVDLLSNCSAITGPDGNRQKHEFKDPSAIDVVFSGDMRAFMEALVFAIEVNFGNFIGGGSAETDESQGDDPPVGKQFKLKSPENSVQSG